MSERADVVIVGGGMMGMSLAWELIKRKSLKVVILEQKYSGYGATGRNIGRVRTSQFSRDLAVFAKSAFEKHARMSDELGHNTLFWTPGYALVYYDDDEIENMTSICEMLGSLGHKTEFHECTDIVKRLPILQGGEDPLGCLIHPDASVHHDALLYSYRKALESKGCSVRENSRVERINVQGGRVEGVETSTGVISASVVVNASGSWSSELAHSIGVDVPNKPYRREVLVSESCKPYMTDMITFYRPVEGWFHQTMRGETVIGVVHPDEPPGRDFSASKEHVSRAADHILRKAPKLRDLRIVRQWAGCYDITPDRKPLIGPSTQIEGFVQANGFSGRGIAFIPYISELLAQWLVDDNRPDELEPFDSNRYAGREDTEIVMGDYYAAYKKQA